MRVVVVASWRGDAGEAAAILQSMEGGPFPISATVVSYLWRSGQEDAAREHYESPPDRPHVGGLVLAAQLGHGRGRLAAPGRPGAGRGRLRPAAALRRATRAAPAPATIAGPVDLFLALAAAARGDRDLAARHAEDAERLCAEWQIPLAAQWLRDQRDRYGF